MSAFYFVLGNISVKYGSRLPLLLSLEILQNCVTPSRNYKVKNEDPWKFHMIFFLSTPRNSTSFLTDPWNFQMLFLQYPWTFHDLSSTQILEKETMWDVELSQTFAIDVIDEIIIEEKYYVWICLIKFSILV